jgi:hypothetical protein
VPPSGSAPAIISTSWWWVRIERILVHVCIACADSVFSMPLACCSLISNDRASFSNCSRFISFSLSARRLSRVELQDWIIWDLIIHRHWQIHSFLLVFVVLCGTCMCQSFPLALVLIV